MLKKPAKINFNEILYVTTEFLKNNCINCKNSSCIFRNGDGGYYHVIDKKPYTKSSDEPLFCYNSSLLKYLGV